MTVRDTLLRAAEAGLYRPYWSDTILDELFRALVRQGLVAREQAARLRRTLQSAFEAASLPRTRYAPLIGAMTNHPKDRHVLAAAVAAGAQVIVTFNLRDFPDTALSPHAIRAQSPDTFLSALFEIEPALLAQIVVEQAEDLQNPPIAVADLVASLAQHAPHFAECVRHELERTDNSS